MTPRLIVSQAIYLRNFDFSDFGRIEKKRKKKDRVTVPSEWVTLIRATDQQRPFHVVYVEHPLTDDMQDDGTDVVQVMDYKAAYEPMIKAVTGISSFRGVVFQPGQVKSRVAMTAACDTLVVILKRGQKMSSLTTLLNLRRAYAAGTFLPIKEKKYDDVIALLGHVTLPPGTVFYEKLRPGGGNGDEQERIMLDVY